MTRGWRHCDNQVTNPALALAFAIALMTFAAEPRALAWAQLPAPPSAEVPAPQPQVPAPPPVIIAPPPDTPIVVAPPSAVIVVPPGALEPPAPPAEPLAGFSDGVAFLRAPDFGFVLFPSGRLQVDTYVFSSDNRVPRDTFLIRRARLETAGWIGSFVYFHLAGDFAIGPPPAADPVAPSNLATTDDYVAIAPWKTYAMLQVGQYDAPFTLENRISDKYFDFMERSIPVRAFGIPENKQVGAMVHGYNEPRNWYYSIGIFDGDGQNFRNVDGKFDWMGRGWVAPLSFRGPEALYDATVGASFWTGDRANTLPLPTQTTQGGFRFLNNAFTWTNGGMSTPVELHQNGRLNAFAFEVNVPYAHRYGLRWEFVWKESPLSVENVTMPAAPVVLGGLNLKGWSTYGQVWWWVIGDDRIIGDVQGIQPYAKLKKFGVKPPQPGLMVTFKVDYLDEDLTEEADAASLAMNDPMVGTTKVTAYELGINAWYSKRFRATFNYVFNHFSGTTSFIRGLPSKNEQEFLFRLAIAL